MPLARARRPGSRRPGTRSIPMLGVLGLAGALTPQAATAQSLRYRIATAHGITAEDAQEASKSSPMRRHCRRTSATAPRVTRRCSRA